MRLSLAVVCVLASVPAVHSWRTHAPTTINVVLVTFPDTDRMPHGYSRSGDTLTPGRDSYTMDDFESKFGVTGADDFEGPVTVGGREKLPESYGSLRDYFREISNRKLDFEVRIINRELSNGYPEWIILKDGRTWEQYFESPYRDHLLIQDGLNATHEYLKDRYAATIGDYADFPTSATRRSASDHVVVFVYSGYQVHQKEGKKSSLHPHAVMGGCCYVTGERQGDGKGPDPGDGTPDASETFTGIGIHAHEMGHVLDVHHPHVATSDENVYAMQTPGVSTYPGTDEHGRPVTITVKDWPGGSVASWCTMASGWDGPATQGSTKGNLAYYFSYASCPNPYNPFHIKQLVNKLGWGNEIHPITKAQEGLTIEASPEHYYDIEGANPDAEGYPRMMLEFRDADSFGRYNSWYEFEHAPGLFVWRQNRDSHTQLRLVPADNRRISNAMAQPVDGAHPNGGTTASSTHGSTNSRTPSERSAKSLR